MTPAPRSPVAPRPLRIALAALGWLVALASALLVEASPADTAPLGFDPRGFDAAGRLGPAITQARELGEGPVGSRQGL